jgi:DNA-binding NarL/FixJ family response regulator
MDSKVKILLADDHQIVIDGLKFMLSSESNFEIAHTALNTNDAEEFLLKNHSDINFILADINMPSISGIELCRKVKQNYPHIKVLILSMYSSKEIIRESILAEADGYMLKNGGKQLLIDAINKISKDGTFYSEEIIPIIYAQLSSLKKQIQETAKLSEREIEVLKMLCKEYSSEEIAGKLFLSVKTIGYHRQNLLQKCDCKSSIGLVKYAIRHGFVELE